jgi:hypothetical protein
MHPAYSFFGHETDRAEPLGALGDATSELSDKIYDKLPAKTPIALPALVGGAVGALGGYGAAVYRKADRMYGTGIGAVAGIAFSIYGSWVGSASERRTISDAAAAEIIKGKP